MCIVTLQAWDEDPGMSLIIIKGAGDKAFCAGGDVVGKIVCLYVCSVMPVCMHLNLYIILCVCMCIYVCMQMGVWFWQWECPYKWWVSDWESFYIWSKKFWVHIILQDILCLIVYLFNYMWIQILNNPENNNIWWYIKQSCYL